MVRRLVVSAVLLGLVGNSGPVLDGSRDLIALSTPPGQPALADPVESLAPGSEAPRLVDVRNVADRPLSTVVLTTVATQSSVLDRDLEHGLRLRVDACSEPWDGSPAAYRCPGTESEVVGWRPVVMERVPLAVLEGLAPDAVAHLRLTTHLPATGPATPGLVTTIDYRFTAAPSLGGGP